MREEELREWDLMKREAEKSEMWLIRMRDWRWRSGIRGNSGGRKEKESNWGKDSGCRKE